MNMLPTSLKETINQSKVISGLVMCTSGDSEQIWRLYSGSPLKYQATTTMTQYPTQSHIPDIEQTSP